MKTSQLSNRQELANFHTCKTLLNCYIREFCQENRNLLSVDSEGRNFTLYFPTSGVTLSGMFSFYSAIGEHDYKSMYIQEEREIHCAELVQWIVKELQQQDSLVTDKTVQSFTNRVDNSYRNLALYLKQSAHAPISNYLSSEQSLLYGHPFHPFPKNTRGFTEDEVSMYCPELQPSFPLCYLAVKKTVFQEEWVSQGRQTKLHESVEEHALSVLASKRDEYEILPIHPWQYKHVQTVKAVRDYIAQENIILLGSLGPIAYPTSSVRTVYVPDMKCNIKLSLDIQITNMMRNNNKEQMRRTLDASNYLLQHNCFDSHPHTEISYEEGVCTCQFEDDEVTKLFTIAYRPIEFDVTSTFVMSSLIESPALGEPARLFSLIDGTQLEQWFRRYLEISLLSIVRVAEEKGIHFEAHSQNCLLTIKNGMPHTFIIRDLEGVSVNQEKVADTIDKTGLLFYEKEKAWARTSYYFIVNHLGSLIHALAKSAQATEEYFWTIVRDVLTDEVKHHHNEYILHLLEAEGFYAKRNMMSCLAGVSETPSYVLVTNIMNKMGSGTSESSKSSKSVE
ncbi:IucA/IucC family protein [Paenibacillus agilis]|uniref:IucA/IucC family protein n=1 Tax=Paenibacillus agilis TaxID=3020863 RepID=UPI0021BD9057|nr:IucA/IucC family protein [Paenibacillus agilis]